MNTYIGTFERKEVKYRLDREKRLSITKALDACMVVDAYGQTRIDSVYFDTADRALIARSLEKPLYKEKLRVRSYGPYEQAQVVFVEIKKKYKGIVYKRRVQMSKLAAEAYLLDGVSYEDALVRFPLKNAQGETLGFEPVNIQIAREIDAFCKRYPLLRPSMLTSCQRVAYEMRAGCESLVPARVTFDTDIAYCDFFKRDFDAAHELAGLLDDGQSVMEVKVAGAFPLWLTDILTETKAYPGSFSKYGTAYQHVLRAPAAPMKRELDVRAFMTSERIRCA